MDWARDISNRLISADKYNGERPIFCPTCNGLIHHRPGYVNRPHFAHNKACSTATRECEYYHPPNVMLSSQNRSTTRSQLKNKLDSLNIGGSFFAFSPLNGGSLAWQLPHIGNCLGQDYIVDFYTKKGIKSAVIGPQSKPPQIQLLPQTPLASITVQNATDESNAVVSFLEQLLCIFSSGFNFFKINDKSSHLLSTNDDLEYDSHYWLLVPKKLPPLPEALQCLISSLEEWHGWYIYELSFEIGYNPLLTILTLQCFGKNLIEKQPNLTFISPLPHHIDDNGVYIFDITSNLLRLKIKNKTANFGIEIFDTDGVIDGAICIENEYVIIDIRSLHNQNLDIFVNKHIKCTIRVEQCPLFVPSGITVLFDDKYLELFDCRLHMAHSHNEELNTIIRLPDHRVKNFLLNSIPKEIVLSEDIKTMTVGIQKGIDASNFGYIPPAQRSANCDANLLGATQSMSHKYLMNLLALIVTPESYTMIQSAPNPRDFLVRLTLQKQLPAWVMTYLRREQ